MCGKWSLMGFTFLPYWFMWHVCCRLGNVVAASLEAVPTVYPEFYGLNPAEAPGPLRVFVFHRACIPRAVVAPAAQQLWAALISVVTLAASEYKFFRNHDKLPAESAQGEIRDFLWTLQRSDAIFFGISKGDAWTLEIGSTTSTLDLMILKTLTPWGRCTGSVSPDVRTAERGSASAERGTVYTSLLRLQHQGWIASEWGASENNRKAKFYSITARPETADPGTENWERIGAYRPGIAPGRAEITMASRLRVFVAKLQGSSGKVEPQRLRQQIAHPPVLLTERFIARACLRGCCSAARRHLAMPLCCRSTTKRNANILVLGNPLARCALPACGSSAITRIHADGGPDAGLGIEPIPLFLRWSMRSC